MKAHENYEIIESVVKFLRMLLTTGHANSGHFQLMYAKYSVG